MKLRKYTLNQLKDAISSSISIRQCLGKLGVAQAGGNYQIFHKAVTHYKLDTSHFSGMDLTGRVLPTRRRPIEEYLSNAFPIGSNSLKKYLLDGEFFNRECSSCGLINWLDRPIPLELDHINGNSNDNSLSNLRLLCPNCHALTSTYRGKNIGKKLSSALPTC